MTNRVGGQISKDVALLHGALERDPATAADPEVRRLVWEGEGFRDLCRDLIHGTRARGQLDKQALRGWWERMQEHRKRLAEMGLEYDGLWGHRNVQLVMTGTRARAQLIRVEDTGATVNNDPYVRLVFRVQRDGGAPFELEEKHLVSRVNIPRPGIELDVFYDPADPTNWTFKEDDLEQAVQTAAPARAEDAIDKLEQLVRLRDAGALTAEEFDQQKRRLLEQPEA